METQLCVFNDGLFYALCARPWVEVIAGAFFTLGWVLLDVAIIL